MRYRNRDAIILVGLNPTAAEEAQALRQLGNEVTLIANARHSGWVSARGRRFDLTDAGQTDSFIRLLGLSVPGRELAARTLRDADRDMDDELGQLAWAWARAEHSGTLPGRMVISGEHVGSGMFWSRTASGYLRISDLATLAEAFPRVARGIEDLHTSACQSANEVFKWQAIFPNLKTIWAYAGSCPGTFSGAAKHLAIWDKATRGPAKTVDRLLAQGTRKGGNVVIWTPLSGLTTGEVSDLAELRARIAAGNATFDQYFDGLINVTDTQGGPLRDYYNWLQEALRHDDLPEAERHTFEKRRDSTIRLIFYDVRVKARFANEYKALIAKGFTSLGLTAPDFGRLPRKDAIAAIAAFEQKADERSIETAEALRGPLVDGLLQLSARYIPENWI